MNKKAAVVVILLFVTITAGCGIQQASESSADKKQTVSRTVQPESKPGDTSSQQNAESGSKPESNLSNYKGEWICSKDSMTSDMVMEKGGCIIDIQQINGQTVKGTYTAVQEPPANRVASVDFEAIVSDNTLNFSFDDDGLGNQGKFRITFEESKISLSAATIISSDNESGWSLGNGSFVFTKQTDGKQ